jgi:hypothetical protein
MESNKRVSKYSSIKIKRNQMGKLEFQQQFAESKEKVEIRKITMLLRIFHKDLVSCLPIVTNGRTEYSTILCGD